MPDTKLTYTIRTVCLSGARPWCAIVKGERLASLVTPRFYEDRDPVSERARAELHRLVGAAPHHAGLEVAGPNDLGQTVGHQAGALHAPVPLPVLGRLALAEILWLEPTDLV